MNRAMSAMMRKWFEMGIASRDMFSELLCIYTWPAMTSNVISCHCLSLSGQQLYPTGRRQANNRDNCDDICGKNL